MRTSKSKENTKQCNICFKTKSVSDFYESKRSKSGYSSRCRLCQNVANQASRERSKREREDPLPWTVRPRSPGRQRYCDTCIDYYNNNAKDCPHCRTEKACTVCRVVKPLDEFYLLRGHADGHDTECKFCVKNKLHPRRNYGMHPDEYLVRLKLQGGKCALCRQLPKENYRLHVDHCHVTGKVRGLTCSKCNHGIGNFNDDTKLFRRVIDYLEGTLDEKYLSSDAISRLLQN